VRDNVNNETNGTDTIFFSIKLKKTRTSEEVFEKMKKKIKKQGVTKRWSYSIENDTMIVDFGDKMSENFCISFNNKECQGFCKMCFPTEGEYFDNEKKSEFKALLNMIISAKSMFSQMKITDDYGIAEDYIESKKYKLNLRELTEQEILFAHDVYDNLRENNMSESYSDFLRLVVMKALDIPVTADYNDYINENIMTKDNDDIREKMFPIFETYLYETAEFKGKRLMEYSEFEYSTDSPGFAVMTFMLAANELYCYRDFYELGNKCISWGKYPQIHKFYRDKVYPQLDKMPDGFEKCCLAFRFFQSTFDYCGFKFVGKLKK
jgi:hypothetical protein